VHTILFHKPRTAPSGRKVIRHIKKERGRKKERGEKTTMYSVATSFAMQPVCNAARAAHALRSDHEYKISAVFTQQEEWMQHWADFAR
jgi:hypothetical protein